MRGPAEAVRRIHEYIDFEAPPIRITSLIVRIVESANVATGDNAAEIAQRWLPTFSKHLKQRIYHEYEISQIPVCEFCPASEEFIQGSCYIAPNCPPGEARERKLRSNKRHYIEQFSILTNDEFERLCSRILSLWKVERDFVTRRSADQGVDFYGRVPFGEIMKRSAIGNGAEKQLKLWLVGQAKNYNASQVSTKDIRELVGSVNLARSKTYAGSVDPLSSLEMRTCDPVFFLFFTTGTISKDAWNLLGKAGVVAMDGAQLAVFLADHAIGIDDNENFNGEAFRIWAFE